MRSVTTGVVSPARTMNVGGRSFMFLNLSVSRCTTIELQEVKTFMCVEAEQ